MSALTVTIITTHFWSKIICNNSHFHRAWDAPLCSEWSWVSRLLKLKYLNSIFQRLKYRLKTYFNYGLVQTFTCTSMWITLTLALLHQCKDGMFTDEVRYIIYKADQHELFNWTFFLLFVTSMSPVLDVSPRVTPLSRERGGFQVLSWVMRL